MNPLYIIPARGGSKGIPHKNIKHLCGRPLIAYTVDAALEAHKITGGTVLLSTDDTVIADTVRAMGLEVPYMRPAALATDTAGSREVILDAMDWADSEGVDYDCVVLLQPTSPFRTADDILACIAALGPDDDMAVTVAPARDNPYYTVFETAEDGTLHISKGDGRYTRRQDVPPAWIYNGAVYVMRPRSIRNMPMGDFPRRIPSVMPAERSIDIDNELDWLIAETIMRRKTF